MGSEIVVIVGVTFQSSAQMRFAEDNDVVQTLTPDRSDQPFGKAVLPRRGWCGRLVPDAHRAQSARDNTAIDPVPIADQVVRSLIPRKRLGYLTWNPFRRRIRSSYGEAPTQLVIRPSCSLAASGLIDDSPGRILLYWWFAPSERPISDITPICSRASFRTPRQVPRWPILRNAARRCA